MCLFVCCKRHICVFFFFCVITYSFTLSLNIIQKSARILLWDIYLYCSTYYLHLDIFACIVTTDPGDITHGTLGFSPGFKLHGGHLCSGAVDSVWKVAISQQTKAAICFANQTLPSLTLCSFVCLFPPETTSQRTTEWERCCFFLLLCFIENNARILNTKQEMHVRCCLYAVWYFSSQERGWLAYMCSNWNMQGKIYNAHCFTHKWLHWVML